MIYDLRVEKNIDLVEKEKYKVTWNIIIHDKVFKKRMERIKNENTINMSLGLAALWMLGVKKRNYLSICDRFNVPGKDLRAFYSSNTILNGYMIFNQEKDADVFQEAIIKLLDELLKNESGIYEQLRINPALNEV